MIIRIVRLSFNQNEVVKFLNIFNEARATILGFEGCQQLQLHKDADKDNVFYTISHWNEAIDLDYYRNSSFFQKTWAKTKLLFDEKPVAYSLEAEE